MRRRPRPTATRQAAVEVDRAAPRPPGRAGRHRGAARCGRRLGRRLAAAGWPSLLDAIDAPEEAWPAIEAVVGGELEGALLWSGRGPDRRQSTPHAARRGCSIPGRAIDAGRDEALAAVGAERTLAEWIGVDRRAAGVPAAPSLRRDLDRAARRMARAARRLERGHRRRRPGRCAWRHRPSRPWRSARRRGRARPRASARAAAAVAERWRPRPTPRRTRRIGQPSGCAARETRTSPPASARRGRADRTARSREELDAAESAAARARGARCAQVEAELAALGDAAGAATPAGGRREPRAATSSRRRADRARRGATSSPRAGRGSRALDADPRPRPRRSRPPTADPAPRPRAARGPRRPAHRGAAGAPGGLEAMTAERATLAAAADEAACAPTAMPRPTRPSEPRRTRGPARPSSATLERDHGGAATALAELERAAQADGDRGVAPRRGARRAGPRARARARGHPGDRPPSPGRGDRRRSTTRRSRPSCAASGAR